MRLLSSTMAKRQRALYQSTILTFGCSPEQGFLYEQLICMLSCPPLHAQC